MTRRMATATTLAKQFEIKQGLARVFETAMRDGCTSPLDALELLAEAIGAVYQEVAAAHIDPRGCPCGWAPAEHQDVRILCDALRQAAGPQRRPLPDLGTLEPAGSA